MTVKHVSQSVSGEIIDIKKSKALVLFDSVKIWLPLNELQAAKANIKHQPKTVTFNVDLFNKQTQFRAEIDLRGIRGEEAMKQLDNWINDAHSLGMSSLRVVHGRGFGILRKLIVDYLTHSKLVKHYDHETEQLGGDGVTIITLY
jgi:DNA mismatch repair protein MutS2